MWRLGDDGFFSVRSMYKKLVGLLEGEDLCSEERKKKRVPSKLEIRGLSKVVASSWKLLHNWIQTKINLAIRNCLPPNDSIKA